MTHFDSMSLGAELVQRNWFGQDTLMARYGAKYDGLKRGDTFDFVTKDPFGNDVRIAGQEIEEVRDVTLKDILKLPAHEVIRSGPSDDARALHDAQYHWYGDRSINEDSPFKLIFYKPSPQAETLKTVRKRITQRLEQMPGITMQIAPENFTYYADGLTHQSLGPTAPEDYNPRLKKGPGIQFHFQWDFKDQNDPVSREDELYAMLEKTFGKTKVSFDDGSFDGGMMREQNSGPYHLSVQVLGTPEEIAQKLESAVGLKRPAGKGAGRGA